MKSRAALVSWTAKDIAASFFVTCAARTTLGPMSSDSGCILQGEEANLSNLRVADPLLLQAALDQICLDGIGNDDDEANLRTTRLLFGPAAMMM
jgi:hypothetical protein